MFLQKKKLKRKKWTIVVVVPTFKAWCFIAWIPCFAFIDKQWVIFPFVFVSLLGQTWGGVKWSGQRLHPPTHYSYVDTQRIDISGTCFWCCHFLLEEKREVPWKTTRTHFHTWRRSQSWLSGTHLLKSLNINKSLKHEFNYSTMNAIPVHFFASNYFNKTFKLKSKLK